MFRVIIYIVLAIIASAGLVFAKPATILLPEHETGKATNTVNDSHNDSPESTDKKDLVLPTASSIDNTKNSSLQSVNVMNTSALTEELFSVTPAWKQDFSTQPNGSIDTSIWNIERGNNNGWGNNEVQVYTNDLRNVRIDNDGLVIEAIKDDKNVYTSARITTANKFDFTYGKIDIVAKLPVGKGVWPAVWFWPTDDKYSSQPVLISEQTMSWINNGEIDLIEGSAWGDSDFTGSAHSLGHYPGNNVRTGKVSVTAPSDVFHTYTLQWTPTDLVMLVDNVAFMRVVNSGGGFREWPYDQRYHLILNIAMGGSMSEKLISPDLPLGIDDAGAPWSMTVKSISYYPLVN